MSVSTVVHQLIDIIQLMSSVSLSQSGPIKQLPFRLITIYDLMINL
jgi:hypothetical protein